MIAVQIGAAIIAILVIAGLLAPLESLGWWAREGRAGTATLLRRNRAAFGQSGTGAESAKSFIVFFSGIGISTPAVIPAKEAPLIEQLAQRISGAKIITDVYPYSPINRGLTGDRQFSWIWRHLEGFKQASRHRRLSFLINIRNAFQCFVSIDQRYGPVYNLGVAEQIWHALARHGYDPANPRPVIILGWSGGAQIAVGSAWYLAALGIPVSVISIAGVFGSDPGLERIQHLWQLSGTADRTRNLGFIASPGRWPIFSSSAWNNVVRDKKVTNVDLGPLTHDGDTNYFSAEPSLPGGQIPREVTLRAIVDILVANQFATQNNEARS